MYRFPRTIFVDINSIKVQLEHSLSEVMESIDALENHEGFIRVAEEILDSIHSLETALRHIEEKSGLNTGNIAEYVRIKNDQRGYYGQTA